MIPPVIEDDVILRTTVGSTVHGLHLPSQDDRDEMGVYIEPPEYVIGLDSLPHHIERTQPEGVRSGPGDLDLTLYSLRKWMALAVKGNPTVLLLLFAPPLQATARGKALQRFAPKIISQEAYPRFRGYLRAQKERLLDVRGGKHTNRPELIALHGYDTKYAMHGYDTKYAMHACRLAHQGIELMQTGRISLPMPEPARTTLLAIRRGKYSLEWVEGYLDGLEASLVEAHAASTVRAYPDYPAVHEFLIESYGLHWGWDIVT